MTIAIPGPLATSEPSATQAGAGQARAPQRADGSSLVRADPRTAPAATGDAGGPPVSTVGAAPVDVAPVSSNLSTITTYDARARSWRFAVIRHPPAGGVEVASGTDFGSSFAAAMGGDIARRTTVSVLA